MGEFFPYLKCYFLLKNTLKLKVIAYKNFTEYLV